MMPMVVPIGKYQRLATASASTAHHDHDTRAAKPAAATTRAPEGDMDRLHEG